MSSRSFVFIRSIAALSVLGVVCFGRVLSADQIWDPLFTGAGSDGVGNWDTTTANWAAAGVDAAWVNGNVADFGSGGTAGTVTLTTPITAGGLTFNSSSGDYTIAASVPANILTINGATPTITVNSGSPTVSAIIAGSTGLTMTGTGSLILSGVNTYTGGTTINSGTVQVNAGGTLGATTGAVILGNTGGTLTTAANLLLNTNATIASFNDTTQTATDTLQIASGSTLTVSGAFTVGQVVSNSTASMVLNSYTGTAVQGSGGTLNVNGAMTVGANPGGGSKITATVDLQALSAFNLNASATTLNIGNGTNIKGILTLASGTNGANFINVTTINMGTSGGGNANGGSALNLGYGTNTIQANSINIGAGKSTANLQFAANAPATASVVITGTGGGTARADITLDSESSGTGTGPSNLSLAGHIATVQAGTLIVARDAGGGGTASANATFDTGTFNVNSLQLGVATSGAAATTGNFTLGSSGSTGTLTVNSSLFLANATGGTGAVAGNFIVNGGTANINCNITNPSTRAATTELDLNAGTLNMNGFAIGSASAPISTVKLTGGTLNNASVISSQKITVGSSLIISGSTQFNLINNGATAGSLDVTAAPGFTLPSGSSIAGGTTVAATISGDLIADTGSRLTPGNNTTAGALTFNNNLSFNNGSTARFKLINTPGAGNDSISATGNLTLNGTVNVELGALGTGPVAGNTYTLFNYAGTLTGNETNINIIPDTRSTWSVVPTASTAQMINVTATSVSAPLALTWIGNVNSNWDHVGAANWRDPSLASQQFFSLDTVTFDDTSTNANSVQLVGQLAPGSVTVNAARNYTFAGTGGITGTTGLSKSGSGTLTLATNNSYSGVTSINGGTLQIGNGGTTGSVGTGQVTITSGTLAINRSDSITLSSIIAGPGNLANNGAGTAAITGVNTFLGSTTINAGTVQVNNSESLGGATAIAGTTNTTTGTANVINGVSSTAGLALGMPLSGTGIPAGSVITAIDAVNGTVTISANATAAGAGAFTIGSNTSGITVASGATLDVGGTGATTNGLVIGPRTVTISGTGVGGNGAIVNSNAGANQQNAFQRITLAADASVGGPGRFDLRNNSPVLDLATHTLTKVGTGQFILVGASVTDGSMLAENGIFSIEAGSSVLANPARPQDTITYDSTIVPGATVTAQFFATAAGTPTITRPMVVKGPVTMGNNSNVAVTVGSNINLQGDLTVTALNANGTGQLTLNGNISETGGSHSLTKNANGTGASTLILGGNNSYTGPTKINGGTLQLGAANRIADVSPMVLGGGTFATAGFSETVNTLSLTANSKIDLGAGASTLQYAASDISTLWSGNTLTVSNWTPTADHLVFGNSALGLGSSATNPIGQINFTGHPAGARILNTGEVVPVLSVLKGDFNQDGAVTGADINVMLQALTNVSAFEAAYAMTPTDISNILDFTSDGQLTNLDIQGELDLVASQPGGGSVAPVPEPASIIVFALGALCTLISSKLRKANR